MVNEWHLTEDCGVFGAALDKTDVSVYIYYGLQALQHRGEESAGIAVYDGSETRLEKGMGLVSEVFNNALIKTLKGNVGIGHVRYSTTGVSNLFNAQPLLAHLMGHSIAVAHNGNLINADELRSELEKEGRIFQTTSDTEIIVQLIAKNLDKGFENALLETIKRIHGSYSLLVLFDDVLVGVRDPNGIRPLCIGKNEAGFLLSSESCALDVVNARLLRDVEPGEVVILSKDGIRSIKENYKDVPTKHCVFEYIYFARPDSVVDGKSVYLSRMEMGRQLARESAVKADWVVPVPDSGNSAARGYAVESGIPSVDGLIKNKYVGRTFIAPEQSMRESALRVKLNVLRELVKDKSIVLVDDSIVRGTTMKRLVRLIKEAGAKEVHLRISSPPIVMPCYFGIDMPSRKQLISAQMSTEEVRNLVGADSLHFLSLEGLINSVGTTALCTGCLNGDYPMDVPKEGNKYLFEKK
ncbi:amidophosphoribosyltransferase [Coprothermobacter platensis]|uniref:amidophosphoribosyltransferase n=1 Tax=Coprothermobacter platensis TaxID=108819 RepID=UPI000361DA7B|nr:amidophosphoribosyltransferase [Coprothermobacter platensis]